MWLWHWLIARVISSRSPGAWMRHLHLAHMPQCDIRDNEELETCSEWGTWSHFQTWPWWGLESAWNEGRLTWLGSSSNTRVCVCMCVRDGWGGALLFKGDLLSLAHQPRPVFLEDMHRRYRLCGNSRETQEPVAYAKLKSRLQISGNRYQLGNSCTHLHAALTGKNGTKWNR